MGKPGRSCVRASTVRGVLVAGFALAAALPRASAAEPVRVAALLPFVSEAVALVPAQAQLVAVARRDLRAPLPAGLVDLGNPHSPDLEGLAAARPGVVVAYRP